MPDRDFTFEIEEHFGTIGSREGGWKKELNLIRWNGGPAKYDIREWDAHHERMSRGVTLTPWEMRKVVDLYVSRNNEAAVARGRAIEAERNARRIAAKQKAEEAATETEQQAEEEALEGAVSPLAEDASQDDVSNERQEEEQGAEF